ncbi:MAG: VWA-like domain-containing protein, partial [Clostridia bacterium]|nr:VWA-like domain-containing protein [Clostridia bacterium]
KDKKNRQQQHNAAKNGSGNDNGSGNAGNNNSKSLSGQFDKHINKNDDVENEPGTVASDKYGKVGRDPNFRPNATESNAQHIREAAISAVQMLERQHGTVPAHLKKLVNEMTEAKVDWKELLSQFITRNSGAGANTWNHPNRRFAYSGVYLPSHESQNMNIAVVLDTSGSVVNLLPQFLGELNGIVKSLGNYKLTVLQNDSKVQQVDEYTDEEPLDLDNVKFKAVGFGGTDLSSAFKHIENNNIEADCIVAMTDGEFSTLDPSLCDIPTLWLISENGTAEHITFGEICEYNN